MRPVFGGNYFSSCSWAERKQEKPGLADLGIPMTANYQPWVLSPEGESHWLPWLCLIGEGIIAEQCRTFLSQVGLR